MLEQGQKVWMVCARYGQIHPITIDCIHEKVTKSGSKVIKTETSRIFAVEGQEFNMSCFFCGLTKADAIAKSVEIINKKLVPHFQVIPDPSTM